VKNLLLSLFHDGGRQANARVVTQTPVLPDDWIQSPFDETLCSRNPGGVAENHDEGHNRFCESKHQKYTYECEGIMEDVESLFHFSRCWPEDAAETLFRRRNQTVSVGQFTALLKKKERAEFMKRKMTLEFIDQNCL